MKKSRIKEILSSNDSSPEYLRTLLPHYHRISILLNLISPLVKDIKNNNLPLQGLEIGVGKGNLVLSMAEEFPEFQWSGVEHPCISNKYLNDRAKINLKLCNLTKEPLPFIDSQFSLVTFSEVLEHLSVEAIQPILKQFHRVLMPKGYLITSTPNFLSFSNRMAMLLGTNVLHRPVIGTEGINQGVFGHIRMYTPNEFISLAKTLGFCVKKVKYYNLYKYVREGIFLKDLLYKLCILNDVMSLMNKRFADDWCVVLKKE